MGASWGFLGKGFRHGRREDVNIQVSRDIASYLNIGALGQRCKRDILEGAIFTAKEGITLLA